MKSKNLRSTSVKSFGSTAAKQLFRYKALLFFVVVAAVYGFIVWEINTLSTAEPSQSDVSQAGQHVAQPRIDPVIVQKMQNLQDNSVSVQSLFDQARQNPFQE